MNDNNEAWLPIPGYEENYEVSDYGRVRSKARFSQQKGRWGTAMVRFPAKDMRVFTQPAGYKYICLCLNGVPTKHLLHRLVLLAFVGPSELQCNHKDGEKANNRLDNLEYCTATENLRHCIDVLGKKRGEGVGNSVLTEDAVRAIRLDGRPIKEIAASYGVSYQAIHMVKSRRNWGHVV